MPDELHDTKKSSLEFTRSELEWLSVVATEATSEGNLLGGDVDRTIALIQRLRNAMRGL